MTATTFSLQITAKAADDRFSGELQLTQRVQRVQRVQVASRCGFPILAFSSSRLPITIGPPFAMKRQPRNQGSGVSRVFSTCKQVEESSTRSATVLHCDKKVWNFLK